MNVQVVTGFVPIEAHPRSPEEYEKLIEKLIEIVPLIDNPIYFMQHPIDQCWLFRYLQWSKLSPTHSVADNPKKNTLGYHIVQHQKTSWLCAAAIAKPQMDIFVWIDAGIHSVPGITNEVIAEAINRAREEKTIVIPGCWNKGVANDVPDSQVNWRFCGGFFVVPRQYLLDLDGALRVETMRHLRETNNLSWEVNTLQRLERNPTVPLPIWWYKADHDASLFRNYPKAHHAS